MRNLRFLFLLLCFLTYACGKDTEEDLVCSDAFTCLTPGDENVITNSCLDNWSCSFRRTANSEVNVDAPEGLVPGGQLVFQMINSTEGDPLIADDEFTHILVFEVDPSRDCFSAEGNQLADLRLHFRQICFCTEIAFVPVTQGCLQGQRQGDGTWRVQGDLTVAYRFGEVEVKLDAVF